MTLFVNEFEVIILKSLYYTVLLKESSLFFKHFYYLFCLLRSIIFDLRSECVFSFMFDKYNIFISLCESVYLFYLSLGTISFFTFNDMLSYFLLKKKVENFVFELSASNFFYNSYTFITSDSNLFSFYLKGSYIFNPLYDSILGSNVFFLNSLFDLEFSPDIFMGSGLSYYKGYLYIPHYLKAFSVWCVENFKVSILLYLNVVHLYLGLVEYYITLGYLESSAFILVLNKYFLDIFSFNEDSFILKDFVSYSFLFSYFIEVVPRIIYLLDIYWYKKKYGIICF